MLRWSLGLDVTLCLNLPQHAVIQSGLLKVKRISEIGILQVSKK